MVICLLDGQPDRPFEERKNGLCSTSYHPPHHRPEADLFRPNSRDDSARSCSSSCFCSTCSETPSCCWPCPDCAHRSAARAAAGGGVRIEQRPRRARHDADDREAEEGSAGVERLMATLAAVLIGAAAVTGMVCAILVIDYRIFQGKWPW